MKKKSGDIILSIFKWIIVLALVIPGLGFLMAGKFMIGIFFISLALGYFFILNGRIKKFSHSQGKDDGERPTRAWYVFAFFFGIIGGVIGYFAVRNQDQAFANDLLKFGIVITVMNTVFGIFL